MTIDGRFTIDDHLLETFVGLGLYRAHDAAGQRYLVSRFDHHPNRMASLGTTFDHPIFPRVVYARENTPGEHGRPEDILVEVEPPGRRCVELPPLAPSAARAAALEFAEIVASLPPLRGLRPEVIYLDGTHLTGLGSRFFQLLANGNKTRAGGPPPAWTLAFMTPGEVRDELSPETNVQALGIALRFWLTGAPAFACDSHESYMPQLLQIIQKQPLFPYDGALANVVAASLANESLQRITELLASSAVDDTDHAMRARLVAEIVAHPADDGARLVFADWLLEREDPRGELIQLQCRAPDPAREAALVAAHGTRWSAHLMPDAYARTFARGFVAMAGGDPKSLTRRHTALLAHGPLPDFT